MGIKIIDGDKVYDEPGALRTRLREFQKISGSGNDYSVVRVVADRAENAAFARTALAVKLRELDIVMTERDRLDALASRLSKECRELAIHCERYDADLEWAIDGKSTRKLTSQ